MPRRPNNRPTLIYWLVDTRPETIAAGWGNGRPFYCGKTVEGLVERLMGHRSVALRYPKRTTSQMVRACGEHIKIVLMETVPPKEDWQAKEKRWIAALRFSFPGATNVSDGGDGCPGMVCSEETKRKIGAGNRGKSPSPETREKMRAAKLGKKQRPAHVANMRAAVKGKPKSPEHVAKVAEALRQRRAAGIVRVQSPEERDRRRQQMRERWKDPEQSAKMRAGLMKRHDRNKAKDAA